MLEKNKDCIIIGAGVGGMTSSIYLKRFNLDIMLLEKELPGGQINKTDFIENYPGFTKVNGFELGEKIFEQVNNLKIPYKNEFVIEVVDEGDLKKVITSNQIYYTRRVIIASGRHPKKLGIKDEDKFNNRGISYCAICDGALYKDKIISIIGSGDGAKTAALYMSKIARKVYLIVRSSSLKGQKYLTDRINNDSKIEILFNKNVIELFGNNKLQQIKLDTGETIDIDGLFIYIGSDPDSHFIDVVKENGYIVVDNNMKTNIDGIFACGDVIKKEVYQITTALSDATIAAINCINSLN